MTAAAVPAARVLVVDDEPDLEPLILQKFRRKIRSGEVEFLFARHGEEALEKLRDDPSIGVVMSDINMPVMDGLTLLTKLGEFNRQFKTVIVSAYDDMRNIRTAMNRGAFDFLTKPIDFQDFETTLHRTLEEWKSHSETVKQREQLFALQSEINIASRIQQGILPRQFPEDPRYEIHARMLPARVVSGDFYDFFPLPNNRVGIALGDVSGKGIPAALYMAVSRTLLRATAAQSLSPLDCLLYVNHVLLRQGDSEMYLTLLYGVLELATGDFDFCVAGQTPPWLVTAAGKVDSLREVRGMMLGMLDDPEIGVSRLRLNPGDSLLLVTDGVLDAEDPQEAPFGEKNLRRALEAAPQLSAPERIQSVFEALTKFSAGTPQTDDVTALAMRFLQR